MNHHDHLQLIAAGVPRDQGGAWVDFGAGGGAFTLALRELAGPRVEIIAVDRDRSALRGLTAAIERQFPGSMLKTVVADFTRPLDLPPLDGIIAANAIHFVPDQASLLRDWQGYLKPGGRLIIVEYDADDGNRWVPYPLSFRRLPRVLPASFSEPVSIGHRPSRFLGGIYAAVASIA